jgi:hypothetical protein
MISPFLLELVTLKNTKPVSFHYPESPSIKSTVAFPTRSFRADPYLLWVFTVWRFDMNLREVTNLMKFLTKPLMCVKMMHSLNVIP